MEIENLIFQGFAKAPTNENPCTRFKFHYCLKVFCLNFVILKIKVGKINVFKKLKKPKNTLFFEQKMKKLFEKRGKNAKMSTILGKSVNSGGGGNKFYAVLDIKAETGSIVSATSPSGKITTIAESTTPGHFLYSAESNGIYVVDSISSQSVHIQVSQEVTSGIRYLVDATPTLNFTYTGIYNNREDGVTELKTSGTLQLLNNVTLDIFLVGGGGSGGAGMGGGGGGGYQFTQKGVFLQSSNTFSIIIGAGGAAVNGGSTIGGLDGKKGGTTSAFGYEALGGDGAYQQTSTYVNHGHGGNGASGGGGADNGSGNRGGNGGSNGSNGGYGSSTTYDAKYSPGSGIGTHIGTREFGESTGKLYSGGGGGTNYTNGGYGGDGGGGTGGSSKGNSGVSNTGGGGGGAYYSSGTSGAGGSGIVCIRHHIFS